MKKKKIKDDKKPGRLDFKLIRAICRAIYHARPSYFFVLAENAFSFLILFMPAEHGLSYKLKRVFKKFLFMPAGYGLPYWLKNQIELRFAESEIIIKS